MTDLPTFLQPSEEDIARERERQDRLRRDFNSRARLSGAEMEAARSQVVEDSLLKSIETAPDKVEKNRLKNQLAEAYAAQGRFLDAAASATNHDDGQLYRRIADALFNNNQCNCSSASTEIVGNTRITLPCYRVLKEIYSRRHERFGFLVECAICRDWFFLESNPLPKPINPANFDIGKTPNDLQRLRA